MDFDEAEYTVAESELFVEVCLSTNTTLLDIMYTVNLRTEDDVAVGKDAC